jgi:hypothetical protein
MAKKVEIKKGAEKPFFLPKKATRRKDKNGRFYYLNEKGIRVSFKQWRAVKTVEKENRELKKIGKVFKKQNEYPDNINFQFYFSQGTAEIKQYLFEFNYLVYINRNIKFKQLGSSELFLWLKEVYEFLETLFELESQENEFEVFYPKIFIVLNFNNKKGEIKIVKFLEGNSKNEFTAIELWNKLK